MMPYEELLWSYPAAHLAVPFDKKSVSVAYRGGCTNSKRAEMVDAVSKAFPSPASDVAVSCRPNFTSLRPEHQAKYRCLLDYDGHGYSRRMAWYLQTGSVVLRGGDIDDILSRLARNHDSSTEGATPVQFWRLESDAAGTEKDTTPEEQGLLASVRSCLTNDTYAKEMSNAALRFWSTYVQRGQEVWTGYMAHLLVQQSQQYTMTLDETEYWKQHRQHSKKQSTGWTHRVSLGGAPLFQSLSESKMVCSAIFDAGTPTGHYGRPHWPYILCGVCYCLVTLSFFYIIALPALWELIHQTLLKKKFLYSRIRAD